MTNDITTRTEPTCERVLEGSRIDCDGMYNCCDCGGNDCGCMYCWSCNACDTCLSSEE